MTATRDGRGVSLSWQCADAAAVSLEHRSPAAMAAPPCGRAGGRGRSGQCTRYCVSWAALRLDTLQMCLLNLTDQAAGTEVSKPVVKYLILSL